MRKQKKLAAITIVVSLFVASFPIKQGIGRTEATADVYSRKWLAFLAAIPKGETLAAAKERLANVSTTIGVIPLGGTGNSEWIFRVDDISEVVVAVNKDEIVISPPEFRPLRKWRRFPDGTIALAARDA